MHSFHHSLVAKAHRYEAEPGRIHARVLELDVEGGHGTHRVRLTGERLTCDCDHHAHQGTCAHVVAVADLLRPHLPADAAGYPTAAAGVP